MNIAIIGASKSKIKYWNIILNFLKQRNFNLFPVNPKENEIENIKTYKNISEISDKINIYVFVVWCEITLEILKNNLELLKNSFVWLQPWSFDDEVLIFLESNNIKYQHEICILKAKEIKDSK